MSNGLTWRMKNERSRNRPEDDSLWQLGGIGKAYKVAYTTRSTVYVSCLGKKEAIPLADFVSDFEEVVL